MELFENIRKIRGKAKIGKILKSQTRRAKATNYAVAKSIGIVYEIKTKDYQFFVNDFVDFLRGEIGFKTIKTIGFYNQKEAPSFLDLGSKFQFLNKTHLNWMYLPKSDEIEDFAKQEFDILIDLTQDYILPVKHVVATSKARFKIGRYSEDNHDFFDFMISLDEKGNVKDFIDQVNHYLQKIKTT